MNLVELFIFLGGGVVDALWICGANRECVDEKQLLRHSRSVSSQNNTCIWRSSHFAIVQIFFHMPEFMYEIGRPICRN